MAQAEGMRRGAWLVAVFAAVVVVVLVAFFVFPGDDSPRPAKRSSASAALAFTTGGHIADVERFTDFGVLPE